MDIIHSMVLIALLVSVYFILDKVDDKGWEKTNLWLRRILFSVFFIVFLWFVYLTCVRNLYD
jgi:hypothetical protein